MALSNEQKLAFETACLEGDWQKIEQIIRQAACFRTAEANFHAIKELIPDGGYAISLKMDDSTGPRIIREILDTTQKIIGDENTLLLIKRDDRREVQSYPLLYSALQNTSLDPKREEGQEILLSFLRISGGFKNLLFSPDMQGIGFRLMSLSLISIKRFFHELTPESIYNGMTAAGPAIFYSIPDDIDRQVKTDVIREYAQQAGGRNLLKAILVGSDKKITNLSPAFSAHESVKKWAEKINMAGGSELLVECLRHNDYALWKGRLNIANKKSIQEWFEVALAAGGQQLVGELINAAAKEERPYSREKVSLISEWAERYGDPDLLQKKWWHTTTPKP